MEITEKLINKFNQIKGRSLLVGVCGRAGAGKTTMTNKIVEELNSHEINSIAHSGDWRFKLDSQGRKKLFENKWREGINQYSLAVNQFTWWDFDNILLDLDKLSKGQEITIKNAYDRLTGKKDLEINLFGGSERIIFYECNILGGVEILEKLDLILLVNTPEDICFERIIKKDLSRRSVADLASRYLIVSHSEYLFYNNLLQKFEEKVITCNSEGLLGEHPEFSPVSHLPVPLVNQEQKIEHKNTVFYEVDSLLINGDYPEKAVFSEQEINHIKELKVNNNHVIAITSRTQEQWSKIENNLAEKEIIFDRILFDLPLGKKDLIKKSSNEQK
jgi:uridine kinase